VNGQLPLFDENKAKKSLLGRVTPLLVEYLLLGGRDGYESIGIVGAFDVTNPDVQAWLDNYVFKFAAKVTQTLSDQLRDELGPGLQGGESIPELMQRVDRVFGAETNKYRSEMIARTEASRAQNQGSVQAWKQSGVVSGTEWAAFDDACEFCQEMDGKTISLGETFFAQGDVMEIGDEESGIQRLSFNYEQVDAPPLHPNCRCTAVPVLKELEEL